MWSTPPPSELPVIHLCLVSTTMAVSQRGKTWGLSPHIVCHRQPSGCAAKMFRWLRRRKVNGDSVSHFEVIIPKACSKKQTNKQKVTLYFVTQKQLLAHFWGIVEDRNILGRRNLWGETNEDTFSSWLDCSVSACEKINSGILLYG